MSVFDEHVRALMAAEDERIEKVVEEMLIRGEGGVRVLRDNLGARVIAVQWDESLPYGHIFEFREKG